MIKFRRKEVKEMKKKLIALGLVAIMLLGVTYVYAQGPSMGPGHRGMRSQESWCPKVSNLTPEQKAKFQELRGKLDDETAQLKGNMLTKRLELRSLWTDPKADPKAIMEKEKELRDLQNQMRDKMIQYKLEAREILTPEQLAEFGSHWGMNHGYGMRHGMGHGMGPGMEHEWGPGMGHGMGYGCGC
jgi:Spy/CpxP family protein refolding chaperone